MSDPYRAQSGEAPIPDRSMFLVWWWRGPWGAAAIVLAFFAFLAMGSGTRDIIRCKDGVCTRSIEPPFGTSWVVNRIDMRGVTDVSVDLVQREVHNPNGTTTYERVPWLVFHRKGGSQRFQCSPRPGPEALLQFAQDPAAPPLTAMCAGDGDPGYGPIAAIALVMALFIGFHGLTVIRMRMRDGMVDFWVLDPHAVFDFVNGIPESADKRRENELLLYPRPKPSWWTLLRARYFSRHHMPPTAPKVLDLLPTPPNKAAERYERVKTFLNA